MPRSMVKSKYRFINCDLSARIITYVEEGTLGSAMNLAPRFQLNLAEKFPRLLHAPIVEAVILINAPPTKPFQQVEFSKRGSPLMRLGSDLRMKPRFPSKLKILPFASLRTYPSASPSRRFLLNRMDILTSSGIAIRVASFP